MYESPWLRKELIRDDNAIYIEPEDVDAYLSSKVPEEHIERFRALLKTLHTSEEAEHEEGNTSSDCVG